MSLHAAVIGGGVSGLVACKELLAAGFSVTVFERGARVGGIWAYSDDPNTPSVMRQTVLNLSRAQMVLSDFPFDKDHPHYLTHQAYEEYLEAYARHFDLMQHVRLHTAVTAVTPVKHGRWIIASRNAGGDTAENTFDRLVVAVGQNQVPFTPQTPGLEIFKGTVIHSVNYKSHEPFNGARVLVVGVANSGADVAVDLSGNAERVLLSGRRGIWLLPRFLLYGKPLDHLLSRRSLSFPSWLSDIFMRYISRFMVGDLKRFDLSTNIKPTTMNPVINDHLAERLATGRVASRPDIARLHENEVEFVDGTRDDIDAVIYCTGFQRVFPFLPSLAMTGQPSSGSPTLSLYKRIIPLSFPTLAMVGHIHGLALTAVAELQARWVARVFTGALTLPTKAKMQEEIDAHASWALLNTHGGISTSEVPPFPYMESLAKDIGCSVDTRALWWDKPQLRKLVISGTFCPHHYRLFGPGKWDGAENAIFDVCGVEIADSKRGRWLARMW